MFSKAFRVTTDIVFGKEMLLFKQTISLGPEETYQFPNWQEPEWKLISDSVLRSCFICCHGVTPNNPSS